MCPSSGFTLSRVESVVSTDLARQVRVIRSAYEVIDDRGAVLTKRFVEWPYRWTHRFEAEHLLERAGFASRPVRRLSARALYVELRRHGFCGAKARYRPRTLPFVQIHV